VQQLSGLDGWFLAMETSSVYGHVGSVCVVDAKVAEGIDSWLTLEHLTRFVESRLPLVPLFRRRLVMVPLGLDHPYWIDDPDFDIEFHVRELALPAPGLRHRVPRPGAGPACPRKRQAAVRAGGPPPCPPAGSQSPVVGALPHHRASWRACGDLLQDPSFRHRRCLRGRPAHRCARHLCGGSTSAGRRGLRG